MCKYAIPGYAVKIAGSDLGGRFLFLSDGIQDNIFFKKIKNPVDTSALKLRKLE